MAVSVETVAAETKTERGQQTRNRLLEVALQLFAEHGYHGASMRQIAEAADVAVGGIYNHFRNKEEILTGVILTWHPLMLIMPTIAETEGQTLEEFIGNAAQQFLDTFAARPELLRIFMIELFDFDGAHLPHLFQQMGPLAMNFHARLSALDARLRPLHPLAFVRIFLGTLIGFYISGKLLRKLPAPHDQAIGTLDDLVQILVHGLLSTKTPHMAEALNDLCGDNDDNTSV
ncbi:MAG: TetR/AcrR family transcriptional regulator [Caldilineaceae bacterium]|nr:TetR/AcrR family transcriptional regulator [Caldilineaceae bacterium]